MVRSNSQPAAHAGRLFPAPARTAILLLLGLSLATSIRGDCRELGFNRISLEQGLSHSTVRCVLQDHRGFMWFGTEDGLNRFDGYSFTIYRHNPADAHSISDNFIWTLLEDRSGTLWVGTNDGGLNRFDPGREQFTAYRYDPANPASLSDNNVRVLCQDSRGHIWAGTNGGGLNRLDPKTGRFTRFQHDPANPGSLCHNMVLCLFEDSDRQLWVGTLNGLDRMAAPAGAFTHFRHDPAIPRSLSSSNIQAIGQDGTGTLWVGTYDGLNRMDRTTGAFTRYQHTPGLPSSLCDNNVITLFTDRSRTLWAGTLHGLAQWIPRTDNFCRYQHNPADPKSLSNDIVLAVGEDAGGSLWIGTAGGGIDKLNPLKFRFTHFANDPFIPDSLSHNTVRAIYEDRAGALWVGTVGGGLNQLVRPSNRFVHYRANPENAQRLSHDTVTAIREDRQGLLWIGTWGGGLNRMDRRTSVFTVYRHDPANPRSISSDIIQAIMEDRSGRLWIGTESGLNQMDRQSGTFTACLHDPADSTSPSDDRIQSNCILEDRSGDIWIGTWHGLNRLEQSTGRFHHFLHDAAVPTSLSDDRVISICETRDGYLWVGTYGGGLNRLDPATGRFISYSEQDGLPNGVIYGILEDSRGDLWLSTNNGLSRFHAPSKTFRNYYVGDGLQSNQFFWGASFQNSRGEMFFGGINGFNMFDPASVQDNSRIPPIVLTAFKKFDHTVRFDRPLSELNQITLSYRENFFGFEFAVLDYAEPGKNTYAYRLEGFDRDWIYCGARRYAGYTNLDGGEYVFRVKGANSEGIWNEPGTSVRIRIQPAIWNTWWFRISMALLLLGSAAGWYRQRIRRIAAKKEELERLVTERTDELRQKNTELEGKKVELEQINNIVQSINTEINFHDLLSSILTEIRIIRGVEKASILVYDKDAGVFRFKASAGWDIQDLEGIELPPDEVHDRYLQNSREIFTDIYLPTGVPWPPDTGKISLAATPKSLLTMRITVSQTVEGYLLLENLQDENAFENQDILLLKNLKEHILSAFIKTRLLEELRLLNEKKNEFLGLAAHDLRNPLNVIINRTGLILRHAKNGSYPSQECVEDLGRIQLSAEQMRQMIGELLDISSIESGKMKLNLHWEKLANLLTESVLFYRRIAEEKSIQLTVEENLTLPDVLIDRSRTLEVLDNLLSNAIKFTYPGGSVRITAEPRGKAVWVHIADTGQGLDDEDLKEIFKSYRKLSARPTGGESSTGLGLAIVKKIVEAHGGNVHVTSRKGMGSTFSFSLPSA